jgi:hypothetical protein
VPTCVQEAESLRWIQEHWHEIEPSAGGKTGRSTQARPAPTLEQVRACKYFHNELMPLVVSALGSSRQGLCSPCKSAVTCRVAQARDMLERAKVDTAVAEAKKEVRCASLCAFMHTRQCFLSFSDSLSRAHSAHDLQSPCAHTASHRSARSTPGCGSNKTKWSSEWPAPAAVSARSSLAPIRPTGAWLPHKDHTCFVSPCPLATVSVSLVPVGS